MEEDEAIRVLTSKDTHIGTHKGDGITWRKLSPAIETAVKALEEIKQYRSIGTVGEIKKVVSFLSVDNNNSIIKDMEELTKYRSIGTVDECQGAMEKQMAKKPERKIQEEDLKIGCITFKAGTKTYWCPSCKKPVTGSDDYCRWCGQAIDRGGR